MADKAYLIAFGGEAVSKDFYGDVVSLTVAESIDIPNSLELRLATRLGDDGAWAYLEDQRLDPFTQISVKLGFTSGEGLAGALGAIGGALGGGGGNDGLIPIFSGYVTSIDVNLEGNPDTAQVVVGASDTSVLLSLEEKIATFKDMSDSDVVSQIVSAYGVSIQADATSTVHQENDTILVQRASDIEFVRNLAQLNGLEFYFEPDESSGEPTAFFRAPSLDGTPQPDLAIQFGDKSNLHSFTARVNAQRPLSVKTQQIDVKENGSNSGQAGDTQLAKLGARDANDLVGGALNNLVTPQDTQAQMLVLGAPTSDPTELNTIAQSVRDEAAWFISAEGEINSDAYKNVLRPHRLVLIKGAGKPFSGKYYVTRVVHELKGDGTYTQRFQARRNARDVDGSEKFGGGGLGLPIPGL